MRWPEYFALSISWRIQLVHKQMLEDIIENLMLSLPISGTVICRALKDNRSAMIDAFVSVGAKLSSTINHGYSCALGI